MKLDKARKETDKILSEMENELTKIYKEAQKDIKKKWTDYMERGEEHLSALRESGDKKAYQEELKKYTLQNDYYKGMVDKITTELSNVNKTALAYVNDALPEIYGINYNQAAETAGSVGVSFNLINQDVVKRMVRDGDIKLPKKKMKVPKDKRWNTKQLNSSVLQGIIQGESMNDIAKRILPVVDNNMNAAIRNARTMVTGSENLGRLDSYKRLSDEGLVLNKVWMATPDGRTRDWHLDMDGQSVPLDEPFIDGLGNELDYPADPMGAPESVYNCRCTMVTEVIGFRKEDGSINAVDHENEGEATHDKRMAVEVSRRESRKAKASTNHVIVNGKDISLTWQRRPDKFDFAIEDILNAQGFDGLPRVVSAEEFERYVQEANDGNGLIMQRTYSAPTQEILDEYRKQLYEGKWYVDCSTGGAQYGQGMYAAADYKGILSDGIKAEMEHYKEVGEGRYAANLQVERYNAIQRAGNNLSEALRLSNMSNEEFAKEFGFENKATSYTETMTLDSSAKIINYDDLMELKRSSEQPLLDEIKSLKSEGLMRGDEKYDNVYEQLLQSRSMDDGSFAASKGYDAINAENHGESGSYTVVLNRTKLIIKGE